MNFIFVDKLAWWKDTRKKALFDLKIWICEQQKKALNQKQKTNFHGFFRRIIKYVA